MKNTARFRFLLIMCFSLALAGCNKDSLKNCEEHERSACNEDANKTNIRIRNASKYDMCNIVVNPSEVNSNYGNLLVGESTCYHTFNLAYSYAFVTFDIGDQSFTFLPDDYFGEAKLSNGKFTYSIDVLDFDDGTLTIRTDED